MSHIHLRIDLHRPLLLTEPSRGVPLPGQDLNNDTGAFEWTGLRTARIALPANSANREQCDASPQLH